MARMRIRATTKPASIDPIPTDSISTDERDELIEAGWRVFENPDGEEFIVPHRKAPPPTIGGNRPGMPAPKLPRPTYSYETRGPDKGKRFELMAWPYSTVTVQDIDDTSEFPKSIKGLNCFAYCWTDTGLHIYQSGRHELLEGADLAYERISRENRGWYGDRLRSKDGLRARLLVTNDESVARVWLQAGGLVRVVKDLVRSYGVSRDRRS